MINIGLNDTDCAAVAQSLSILLADTYALYQKTHNYHWNVTGAMFPSYHLLFEQQYQELWNSVDEIAERIRALGILVPGSQQLARLAKITELAQLPDAIGMVRDLLQGQEVAIKTINEAAMIAEKANDQGTLDLLARRIQAHQKNAWMLNSIL